MKNYKFIFRTKEFKSWTNPIFYNCKSIISSKNISENSVISKKTGM